MGQNLSRACFVTKVLLEHSHACSLTYSLGLLWSCNCRVEYLQQRPSGLKKQKPFTNLYRKSLLTPWVKLWFLSMQRLKG